VFAAFDAIARKSPHRGNPCAIGIFKQSKKYDARRCAVARCASDTRCLRSATATIERGCALGRAASRKNTGFFIAL